MEEWGNEIEYGRLVSRLAIPEGRVDMVLDTDTYNEIDDQFALCYALLSRGRLHVEAIYAAPFFNSRSTGPEDGMLKSHAEILRLISKLKVAPEGFVYEGSRTYLPNTSTPVDSPAARDLVARAMARPEDASSLFVVAIGAITNVASALLMEPRIAQKIHVVWLGGHALHWPDTREFNLIQDIPAAQVVLDSGAPVLLVPCMGVASHMLATPAELQEHLMGQNPLCDELVRQFSVYETNHFGWSKEIWDVAAVAALLEPAWAPSILQASPLITNDGHWAFDARRHPIRVVSELNRNAIFRDMYSKLRAAL